VAEEFSIIGYDNNGFSSQDTAKVFNLLFAVEHKISRMITAGSPCCLNIVGLLVRRGTGDSMILDTSKNTFPAGRYVRLNVFVV